MQVASFTDLSNSICAFGIKVQMRVVRFVFDAYTPFDENMLQLYTLLAHPTQLVPHS